MRQTIRIALVFGLLLTLAGLQAHAATTKITYAAWIGSPEEIEQTQARLRAFEAANPGVEVELFSMATTAGYADRLITMMASGDAPDLFMLSRVNQDTFWSAGFLEPITSFVEKDPTINWPDLVGRNQVTMDGEIWGIPEHGGAFTLAFNAAHFDEAGLTRPDELYSRGEWTFETFGEYARRLSYDRNGDGENDVYGTSPLTSREILYATIEALGARVFSEDGREVLIDSPETIEAMRFVTELDHVYNAVGGVFAQGTQSMFGSCPRCTFRNWSIQAYDFEWNVVPYPKGPAGHKAGGGFNSLFVFSGSPNKELAYKLGAYLKSEELQMELARRGDVFTPTRVSVLTSREMQNSFAPLDLRAWAISSSEFLAPVALNVPGVWDHVTLLQNEMAAVARGEKEIGTTAESVAGVVRGYLKEHQE